MQSRDQIDQLLRQTSDAKEIPGVVAVAATGKDMIYQGVFGKRDLSKSNPMTTDSVFWIASMTKAVTAAGAMQLVEQGKLSLDEPMANSCPISLHRKCSTASTPKASHNYGRRRRRSRYDTL